MCPEFQLGVVGEQCGFGCPLQGTELPFVLLSPGPAAGQGVGSTVLEAGDQLSERRTAGSSESMWVGGLVVDTLCHGSREHAQLGD